MRDVMLALEQRDAICPAPSGGRRGAREDRQNDGGNRRDRPDWLRATALAIMHLGCLAVFWTGWSWTVIGLAVGFYVLRAFGLTAFYHRYFSHRAFRTSRWFQFVGALWGSLALQKGPLWWAAHHRDHHRRSDREGDVHSPHRHGFLWAHMGWFLTPRNNELRAELVRDWAQYTELRWLERCIPVLPFVLAALVYGVGELCALLLPALRIDGPMLLAWVFFVSTVALYHATYSVNSIAHLFGSRRFETCDHSRNNALVALLTLGEGWHNNHHRCPKSARQGFVWWEFDPTWYALLVLRRLGLVWDLRPIPQQIWQSAETPAPAVRRR